MIPHHAGAILMFEKAPISGADVKELCQKIIASQRSEIAQMKRMLIAAGNLSRSATHRAAFWASASKPR
jgi:uncharacterized protein (DUF305 family)